MSSDIPLNTCVTAPGPGQIEEIIRLLRVSRPLSAYAAAPDIVNNAAGWTDAKSLTTAARLVDRLGASQLSRQWHRLNFRRHPDDDVCFLHRCYDLAGTIGLLPLLRMLQQRLERPAMPPKHRADLLAATASFLAAFRDFERAHQLIREALAIRPDAPWLLNCQASILRREDRREEALEVCRAALALRPESGQTIESAAVLLIELNRDEEAERLLTEGCARNESSALRWQLYVFHSERERGHEALRWLAEYERLLPLLSAKDRRALQNNRAGIHLLNGDTGAAMAAAQECGGHFHERFAENLQSPKAAEGRRIRLPVGFVRQHHMTCGPATLSALAGYWGRPAPHPEIADKICYDGTSNYSERTWAEEQGLDGREFCVTPETASALIDRGVPFTLVTTWATGAHLQAVIGTDSRAGLLLIRDPSHSHYTEALLTGFLKDYEAHGPRGMLVLPREERHRVEGVLLPESDLYDLHHRVSAALERHDREAAAEAFAALVRTAPGHRMRWSAQVALAAYDDDPVKSHEAHLALAALYPDNEACAWRAFRASSARLRRQENIEALERHVARPKSDRVFLAELAQYLAGDSRSVPRARRILMRLLRANPGDSRSLTSLADCLWSERQFSGALELYRLAACAADKNEGCAAAYFDACRRLNRAEEGLEFLRRRTAAFGRLSAAPWRTLSNSLDGLLRSEEALEAVRQARQIRPQDGELLVHEAGLLHGLGRFAPAEALLNEARGLVPLHEWHRNYAWLEQARGQTAEALRHWRCVLDSEPLAMDAHQALVRITAESEGLDAALKLLAETCGRWPWHMGLARNQVTWLRRAGRAEAEGELRRILEHNPADDWAWRELALELALRGRHAEAVEAAEESIRLAPGYAISHAIYAEVLHGAGRTEEAHRSVRQALELDVTCGFMHLLMGTAADPAAKRGAIDFLYAELVKQTAGGAAVSEFHSTALPHLITPDLTAVLREAREARPDLFETWATLAEHLLNLQNAEALEITGEMIRRFPGAPGSWRLHSMACGAAGRKGERLQALSRAVEINPLWSLAVRELAELHEREGRVEEALEVMRRMARARPLEAANHGVLADMLLRHGQRVEAMQAIERSVEVEPGYDWGWSKLAALCREDGTTSRVVEAARRLTRQRPDEPRSWIVLAETLFRVDLKEEALTGVEQVLERWPRNSRLHDLRALLLDALGRRPEAIAACAPAVYRGTVPRELRARQAALMMEAADYAAAESCLHALVEQEPDYVWPRSLLYDIHRMRGENDRCLELSRELVRLEPDSAVAAGILAESLIAAKKTPEAMNAVRRALELDPSYTYAAARLFDDLMERRDWNAAEELLALMERFQRGPRSLLASCRLALARNEVDTALRLAVELMQSDAPGAPGAMDALLKAWPDTKEVRRKLDSVIKAAVEEARAKNPGVSTPYAALFGGDQVPAQFRRVLGLSLSGPVREAVLRDLLYRVSDSGSHAAGLKMVNEHRALLRESTVLWGSVSYVMFQAGKYQELVLWAADWRDRKDREPWMVANLALAHAWHSGPMSAAAAWEDVLAAGVSNVWVQSAAGLAFVCMMRDDRDSAERWLANLQGQELSAEDRFSVACARAAMAAADAGTTRRPESRKIAGAIWNDAVKAWPGHSGAARAKHYLRDLRQWIARHRYDPAFATIPQSSRRKLEEVPGWLITAVVIIVLGLLRTCAEKQEAESRLPGSSSPGQKPQGPLFPMPESRQ